MCVPYRALSVWVVTTASGVPAAQRPPATYRTRSTKPATGVISCGDEHDGGPVLVVVGIEQRGDRVLGGRVEGQQRLVAQQQPRASGQRLGDPQPLLLATGQQPDRRVGVVPRADRLDDGVDLAGTGSRQAPAVPVHAELDQVPAPDGQVPVEVPLLRHIAGHRAAAPGCPPVDGDRAGRQREQAQQHLQQRGLAAPVGAQDGHAFPGGDVELEVVPDHVVAIPQRRAAQPHRCPGHLAPASASSRAVAWASCQAW